MSGITSLTRARSLVPPRGGAGNSHWPVWETS